MAVLVGFHLASPCQQQDQGAGTQTEARSGRGTCPLYEIRMEPKDIEALERNPWSEKTFPATFSAEGASYGRVQIRCRGAWARSWPKKALKIFFSREKPFHGHHSLNLNSAWRDPAFVRETLAYQVYAACGVPASRSRLVRLHFNGEFRGLYVEVEQVDKTLLRRFSLQGATLLKAASGDNRADERDLGNEAAYNGHYENETPKNTNAFAELRLFCRELAGATNTAAFFNERVDLDKYINYLAACVLVQHWDGLNKNHFLIYDGRGSKKWFVIPWDLDRTFGDHWNHSYSAVELPVFLGARRLPGPTGWNRLADRFFSEPGLRARFLKRLEELLETEFTTEKLFRSLDELEAGIGAEAALDRRRWPGQRENLHSGIAGVKRFIERRRTFLLEHLQKLRETRPGQ